MHSVLSVVSILVLSAFSARTTAARYRRPDGGTALVVDRHVRRNARRYSPCGETAAAGCVFGRRGVISDAERRARVNDCVLAAGY